MVDTGVHSQHWTRQQMVAVLPRPLGHRRDRACRPRWTATSRGPARRSAYKIGQLKILELRDRAKKALGDKFDLRAFHDQVLDAGALPLDVLSDRIDAWIAAAEDRSRALGLALTCINPGCAIAT